MKLDDQANTIHTHYTLEIPDGMKHEAKRVKFSPEEILVVHLEDVEGWVWIGTARGICVIYRSIDKRTNHSRKALLSPVTQSSSNAHQSTLSKPRIRVFMIELIVMCFLLEYIVLVLMMTGT